MSVEAPIYSNKDLLPVNIQEHLRREERLHPEATGCPGPLLTEHFLLLII